MAQNWIKKEARERPNFRRRCIAVAQPIHRLDMRLRLGLLQDAAAIDRQIAREAAEAQAKKEKAEIPTVKTEAQTKAEEESSTKEKEKASDKTKSQSKPRIRPLSEAKAVEFGANFLSESITFSVALTCLLLEFYRSRRKEASRREDAAEELDELKNDNRAIKKALVDYEREIMRLRPKDGKHHDHGRILPKELWQSDEVDQDDTVPAARGWFSWIKGFGRYESSSPPMEDSSPTSSAIQPDRKPEQDTVTAAIPSRVPPMAQPDADKK